MKDVMRFAASCVWLVVVTCLNVLFRQCIFSVN